MSNDSLIKTGNGLLVIDVDKEDEIPEWVWDLIESNPTLTVQSCHAEGREGHYPFLIDEDIETRDRPWGEIRCEGSLVVTPGSEVHGIRGGKDCKDGCCTPDDPGQYTVKRDLSIAPIEADDPQ